MDPSKVRKARFQEAEPVVVTTPGVYQHRQGLVLEVLQPRGGDFIYRYRVQFSDGTCGTFFGFELRRRDAQTQQSA
jgi:hypothetical protein